jgi:DNA-binding CsgD family transcriptional regulator
MTAASSLARGRELFEGQRWEDVHILLSEVDRDQPLEPEELVQLATSAQMIGRDAEAASAWSRAHTEFLKRGEIMRAVRCVYWLVIPMLFRGEMAQAGGWLARAQRLLQDAPPDNAEHGYLLFAAALRSVREGDVAGAHVSFVEATRIGERVGDADLVAQARMGEGRTLIRLNETARGAALLDEVMAAVTASAVSPLISGGIYCSVLEACQEMFDLRRAREWTDAMTMWCARQPDSLGFRGQCLIHRAELMQLNGEWSGASDEAKRARDRLMQPPPHGAVGAAHYQIAELDRVRGDFAAAEEEYRNASRAGFDPQPGLALLRLAQGQTASAMAIIARAMDESRDVQRRSRLMPAFVEIAVEAAEVASARAVAEEIAALAALHGTPLLRASAAQAMGAVHLGEGNARGALAPLREAFALWRDLEAPYEAARARVLIARACRALDDADTASLELESARQLFAELGAAHDVAVIAALERAVATTSAKDELTSREREVLRLVATGKTNRAIAATLGISDKTVARHVSNIFTKLGLASRTAATAYAYEHGLFGRAT